MRIAIAGIATESSTFSRDRTPKERFTLMRGDDYLDNYGWKTRFADLGTDIEFVPLLVASVLAGGPVVPAAFDEFLAEIEAGLHSEGPFDGIYLHMHGAVNVLGREDAEETVLRTVRATVGPDPVIGMVMDPHGNLSEELARATDLAACHRRAPHVDREDTRDRTLRHIVATVRRGEKPLKAWVRIPSLLPGEQTGTEAEPGRRIFGRLQPLIEKYGVLDANLWTSFTWADEPRNSASAFVTGYDRDAVRECAEELARSFWDAQEEFGFVADRWGSWSEAIDFAVDTDLSPLWISDAGDNVTAGSSGDITFALSETLKREDLLTGGKQILFAGLVDPGSLELAVQAGIGATLDRGIGAYLDDRYAGPVRRPWIVEKFVDGLYGEGIVAAVLRHGSVTVSIQSHRVYFVTPADPGFAGYPSPGLAHFDTSVYDVVVVKNGYLFPGQAAVAAASFMAITPGGTDMDLQRMEYTRIQRPMFPFDRGFEADLTPKLIDSWS
ncbi:MAG: microcystin degradation protein MlrC [Pseudonocardiales bacterium]|nr:microcystin degradation protein MlrC [Pseudonocardiales bacterium]